MGRLTRWGCDHRGRVLVPARLGRGYVRRADRRAADARLTQACAIPEPIEVAEAPWAAGEAAQAMPGDDGPADAPVRDLADPVAYPDLDRDDAELDYERLTQALRQARPPLDLTRFVAAMRRKVPPTAPPTGPRPIAPSRDGCARCGVPGFKGCAHQAPYEDAPVLEYRRGGGRLYRGNL